MLNHLPPSSRATAEHDAPEPWSVVDDRSGVVVVDLSQAPELMTVDFARLLLLRRGLLGQGRDLQLTGLSGKAKSVYDISRLQTALPVVNAVPLEADSTSQTGRASNGRSKTPYNAHAAKVGSRLPGVA